MKKLFIISLLCILPLLCTSCFKETDLGFPDTVSFSSEGGVKTVTGKTDYTHAVIVDYKTGEQGEVEETEDGTSYNIYRWLKVEYKEYTGNNRELKIYAEPNTTGQSRKLHVEIYSGPEYEAIEINQN